MNSSEDGQAVGSSISDLCSAGITKQCFDFNLKQRTAFKKPNTIPLFEEGDKKSRSVRKYFPNVNIERDGKDYFINKTTAVWLLQEGVLTASFGKEPYSNGSLFLILSATNHHNVNTFRLVMFVCSIIQECPTGKLG